MWDFIANPAVQAGAGILVLCVLIATTFYLLSSFRDYTANDKEYVAGALSNLEEMHRKGDISDAEFRTIQATTQRPLEEANEEDGPSDDEPSPED